MFDVGRAKRMARFNGGSGNQGIGQRDAAGEGVLFNDRGRGGSRQIRKEAVYETGGGGVTAGFGGLPASSQRAE